MYFYGFVAYFLLDMSAISKLAKQIKAMERRARQLSSKEIVVGWANDAREQPRAMAKAKALEINAKNVGKNGRQKRKPEFVSNFDENFIGPGRLSASLATIAKTLCYGREGGTTKDGREYGRIPARNFVQVLKEKHWKPMNRAVADQVLRQGEKEDVNMDFLGVIAKGQLQRAIKDSNEYAPNAPFTKTGGWMANPINGKPFKAEPKGGERPLINTGTLVNSVDFEIRSK